MHYIVITLCRYYDVSMFSLFPRFNNSNDELYFLKGVSALVTLVIAQHQVTILLDRHQLGHKRTVLITVGIETVPTIQHIQILFPYIILYHIL